MELLQRHDATHELFTPPSSCAAFAHEEVAPIFDDVVQLFKTSQTTISPTLLMSYGGPFGENYWYTKENVHDDPKLQRFMPEVELDRKSRRGGPGVGGSPG